MARTNADENLRDVIGNYVIQLVQLQTAVNMLSDKLLAAETRVKELEEQASPQKLKIVPQRNELQHDPEVNPQN